jgi:hypothetical protein
MIRRSRQTVLLARRAPTIMRWSLDARSEEQSAYSFWESRGIRRPLLNDAVKSSEGPRFWEGMGRRGSNEPALLLAQRAASEGWEGSGQVPLLLAERAIKTCSLDARSKGQPWPLPKALARANGTSRRAIGWAGGKAARSGRSTATIHKRASLERSFRWIQDSAAPI